MRVSRFSLRIIVPLVCLAIATDFILRAPAPEGIADAVFKDATIFTGDPRMPWAEAMALRKGRILEIGSLETVQAKTGPNTQYEDLKGRFVVPGFIDSHLHLISGGLQMLQINLQDIYSQSEFIKQVQLGMQGVKNGQWVLGGGWNNEKWGGELPSASWIDSFTRENPVWIYRMDGHMALANSKALQVAGITEDIAEPEGGSFIRAKDGGLTGILIDSAMKLVVDCIPEATAQERRDALTRASKEALSQGVTAVVDFGRFLPGSPTTKVWNDFHDVYKWADQMSNLLLRVYVFFPLETWSEVDVAGKGGAEEKGMAGRSSSSSSMAGSRGCGLHSGGLAAGPREGERGHGGLLAAGSRKRERERAETLHEREIEVGDSHSLQTSFRDLLHLSYLQREGVTLQQAKAVRSRRRPLAPWYWS